MTEFKLEDINETIEAGTKIEMPGRATMEKRLEMDTTKSLLENTIELVELKITLKKNLTLAQRLVEKLRQDKIALKELKSELNNNIDKFNGNDKREEIAERVATSLISESY